MYRLLKGSRRCNLQCGTQCIQFRDRIDFALNQPMVHYGRQFSYTFKKKEWGRVSKLCSASLRNLKWKVILILAVENLTFSRYANWHFSFSIDMKCYTYNLKKKNMKVDLIINMPVTKHLQDIWTSWPRKWGKKWGVLIMLTMQSEQLANRLERW